VELIQEIGSYAGLAAIPGLAILSALLFSQARDVRRLREWAGRAPERAGTQAQQQAGRVVAAPAARPPGAQAAPQPVRTGAAAAASGAPASSGGTATAAPPRTGAPTTPGGPKPIAPRIPASTAAGQTSILGPAGGPPQAPWYRRLADRLPAGRYIAIILVGIAVVGGGVAFGITQLSKDDSAGGTEKAAKSDGAGSKKAEEAKPAPVKPGDVSVTVLNGTVVTGLAHNIGTRLSSEGFQLENQLTATEGGVAESVVLFKPGANREAQLVAKELDISQIEPADSNATAQGGNAEVIVLVGADLAQQ
jgi:hypothetical protein